MSGWRRRCRGRLYAPQIAGLLTAHVDDPVHYEVTANHVFGKLDEEATVGSGMAGVTDIYTDVHS